MFPLDPDLRLGPARYLATVHQPGTDQPAIDATRRVLVSDPHSAELHRNLAVYLLETGDAAGSQAEIDAVWRPFRR